MPAKGTKRATAKGEGHAGDISDNISEDDSAGQALDALATRRELTPSMQATDQDDGRPQAPSDIFPAVFSTPSVVRQERNISPDLRLDKAPNLQEQYDLALQEHRYEDLSGIEQAMLVEQSDMQQRWDLAVKEKRWVDAARYRDIVKSKNAEDTTPAVHAPHSLPPRVKRERSTLIQARPSDISEDTIRAAQLAHVYDNPPIRPLPIRQEPFSDTMDMQEALIARWFQETQMHDREMASDYLVKADWHIDVAVERYTLDINKWCVQTQVHDVRTAALWIRRWDFDLSQAVAAWARTN